LQWALNYALDTYPWKDSWARLMQSGMALDFSWDVQGKEYVDVQPAHRKGLKTQGLDQSVPTSPRRLPPRRNIAPLTCVSYSA
jgi:hypothetical protein